MQPIVNMDDVELALGTTENTNDFPDISLITNKLRNITTSKKENESLKLNIRTDMSLSMVSQNRTWTGLNPHDTRPPVMIATEGRKGTPSSGYTNAESEDRS